MLKPPSLVDLTYRQILEKGVNRAFQESRGVLNDFTRHNPLYALISALSYAATEVLHYANKFAERFALIYLGYISETPDNTGVAAKTIIEFTLTQATVVEIPVGTKVVGNDSRGDLIIFTTDENLIFNGSEETKTVSATADAIGSRFSIAPYTLDRLLQPISFIASVANITQATGSDPVTQDEFITSALARLRYRSLVSEDDFIYQAELAMGQNSLASAIGNLSADRASTELGSVHLFLMSSNNEPADATLISQVSGYIQLNSPPMLGTNLYFSPMEIIRVRVEIVAQITAQVTFADTADRLHRELVNYLSVKNHRAGDEFNIRQFESRLWLIPGIINFEPITVNDGNVSLSCAKFQKFVPQYISATLIQDGVSNEILIGIGELDENQIELEI